MLSIYDLYDLHAVLIRIRFNPENSINYDIVLRIKDVLVNKRNDNSSNQIRVELQKVDGLKDSGLYDFVYVENVYSYYPLPFLKDKTIYDILIDACNEMLCVIESKNSKQLADLAECLHNLPIIIVDNNFSIPKSYWKNEIKCYRKIWNEKFLNRQ